MVLPTPLLTRIVTLRLVVSNQTADPFLPLWSTTLRRRSLRLTHLSQNQELARSPPPWTSTGCWSWVALPTHLLGRVFCTTPRQGNGSQIGLISTLPVVTTRASASSTTTAKPTTTRWYMPLAATTPVLWTALKSWIYLLVSHDGESSLNDSRRNVLDAPSSSIPRTPTTLLLLVVRARIRARLYR